MVKRLATILILVGLMLAVEPWLTAADTDTFVLEVHGLV